MSKLSDVNTTDIFEAIRLGCRTMQRVFNADDNGIPFFGAEVRPEAYMAFSAVHGESHVPGRHLNALLSAENAAGIQIDEAAIEKHARAAFFSYGGPVPLPLNRVDIGGPLASFSAHNVREGFHALYSLVRFRDSQNARRLAEASIEAVFDFWDSVEGWNATRLEREHGVTMRPDQSFISGLARAIGPLVKYFRSTGYRPALELALVLKDKAIGEFYTHEGAYDNRTFGTHVHSVTCVMSSLAQLADLTHDSALMSRVRAFYENGLSELRDELGWSAESSGSDVNADRGETNNSGDILETALILGRWGYPEYYHDAERILRGHILPSQLRDTSFIEATPNPGGEDGKRDVAGRLRGSFGFPAPYGHEPLGIQRVQFNLDIVGGTVASLCEAYREAARFDQVGHWVNLLFDHETPDIKVESPYTHSALRVTAKRPGPVLIRVPLWVDRPKAAIRGVIGEPHFTGGYVLVSQPPVNQAITLEFPLTVRDIALKHRTRDIRARLRGDEVVAMDSFGADLTFFDPLD